MIATVVLGTAGAAALTTAIAKQAARSADALGGALAHPLLTPTSTPTPTAAVAPPVVRAPPATDDFDRVEPVTTTTAAPARSPTFAPPATAVPPPDRVVVTRPGAEPVTITIGREDAGAAGTTTLTSAETAARDAGLVEARPTPAPAAPPPTPTGGAGPFVTEAPPWGASAYETNPDAGAGPFGTDRSTRPTP